MLTRLAMYNFNTLILSIYFSNNNVLFSFTNLKGELLYFVTAGSKKTKGTQKISLTTLKIVIFTITKKIHFNRLHIKVKGFSKFKRLTLKLLLKNFEFKVLSFCDLTMLPHNGVKVCKKRRV
uniref:ribosomal protein S11 n=1 Tax=Campylaephora kondoi TaxID=218449 RepID=UPI002E75D26A|nr:ribosomal protein S11 [Campylaephora kondoi]WQF69470.1 ribosomal protein S11 [Campylaephora kondoi]